MEDEERGSQNKIRAGTTLGSTIIIWREISGVQLKNQNVYINFVV